MYLWISKFTSICISDQLNSLGIDIVLFHILAGYLSTEVILPYYLIFTKARKEGKKHHIEEKKERGGAKEENNHLVPQQPPRCAQLPQSTKCITATCELLLVGLSLASAQ